jgi:hypothetical protein
VLADRECEGGREVAISAMLADHRGGGGGAHFNDDNKAVLALLLFKAPTNARLYIT